MRPAGMPAGCVVKVVCRRGSRPGSLFYSMAFSPGHSCSAQRQLNTGSLLRKCRLVLSEQLVLPVEVSSWF